MLRVKHLIVIDWLLSCISELNSEWNTLSWTSNKVFEKEVVISERNTVLKVYYSHMRGTWLWITTFTTCRIQTDGLTERPNSVLYKYRPVSVFPVSTIHFVLWATIYRVTRKLGSTELSNHYLVIYIVKLNPAQIKFWDSGLPFNWHSWDLKAAPKICLWQRRQGLSPTPSLFFLCSLATSLSLISFFPIFLILFSLNPALPQHWPQTASASNICLVGTSLSPHPLICLLQAVLGSPSWDSGPEGWMVERVAVEENKQNKAYYPEGKFIGRYFKTTIHITLIFSVSFLLILEFRNHTCVLHHLPQHSA